MGYANMSNIYVLIGNIASGKSAFKKQFKEDNPDNTSVVCRDNFRYAFGDGTYLFDRKFEDLIKWMANDYFERLLLLDIQNIIIDETHISVKSRSLMFHAYNRLVSSGECYEYTINAIVFPDMGLDVHVGRRLNDNHGDTSRSTWEGVYRGLRDAYEPPSRKEGFDKITYITGGGN